MEKLSTKFKSTVPSKYINFNIRGAYFSTSMSNLVKGAEQTYFSVLARGQFKIDVDPTDGAIFIDRSTFWVPGGVEPHFGRLGQPEHHVGSLSRDCAGRGGFYQVHSLLKLLAPPPPQFSTVFKGPQVSFSSNNTVATRWVEADGDSSIVSSSTPLVIPDNTEFVEKIIKLVSISNGSRLSAGLAPSTLLSDQFTSSTTCGYHCDVRLDLWGKGIDNGNGGVHFKVGRFKEKSIVKLRLHRDKSVSIVVDGEDLGVAFHDVETSEPLYLVVEMYHVGFCMEFLS
jgi:hypothetical protein